MLQVDKNMDINYSQNITIKFFSISAIRDKNDTQNQ